MIADDLFAGAGGWDLAARSLGIEAGGVEKMPEARATRDANDLLTIGSDVWDYTPRQAAELGLASPPCQTFSQQGSGAGNRDLHLVLAAIRSGAWLDLDRLRAVSTDERTALVLTPLHHAMTGPYRCVAWEQVPAVLPVWQACARVLMGAGWHVWTGLLSADHYGVGQRRRRAVLIASRDRVVRPPTPTHAHPGLPAVVTGAQALGWDLATVKARTRTEGAYEPDMAEGLPRDSWLWHRPATTVTSGASIPPPSYRKPGQGQSNAKGVVDLTPAEAGVLQGFPADFTWCGSTSAQHLQAGNAVPVGLARAVLAEAAGIAEAQPPRDADLFDLLGAP